MIEGSESISTKRFSRTPRPEGVIGKAEMQMIIGTMTNRATGGIRKCNPHAKAIICNTQSAFSSIESESVRETKKRSLPNCRQESKDFSSHAPFGNRRSQARAPGQRFDNPPQNARIRTTVQLADMARMTI